jgi:hypothetical protein
MNPLSGHLLRLIGRRHYLAVWHEIDNFCKTRQNEEVTMWSKNTQKLIYKFFMRIRSSFKALFTGSMKMIHVNSFIPAFFLPEKNRRFRAAAQRLMFNPRLRERIKLIPLESGRGMLVLLSINLHSLLLQRK